MKPIAITLGDPAGIGPEIIAKAFRDGGDQMLGCFVAGDLACLRRGAAAIQRGQAGMPIAVIEAPAEALQVPPHCIPLLQVVSEQVPPPLGAVSAAAGRIAADCVTWAARAALRGDIAAMVTAPLHKEALAAAGVRFPGHTELLQAEAAASLGRTVAEVPVRMMLASDELRTVLVSIHVSLRDAIEAVDFENVLQTLRIAHASLSAMLPGKPRIAVAGLNPHAGEGGLFGREELDIIMPAVQAARAEGIDARGPFAPDTVFMRARSSSAHV